MSLNVTTSETSVERVTFFEDRARVHRVARVELSPGLHVLKLSGISVLVADETLQTGVNDGAKVMTASVRRKMEMRDLTSPTEIQVLAKKVEDLAREHEAAKRRMKRASAGADRTVGIETTLLTQIYQAREGLGADPNDIAATFAAIDQAHDESHEQSKEWARKVDTLARDFEQASLSLSNGRQKQPRISTNVEVQLQVEEAGTFDISLKYFVPCALWRPAHVAKLQRAGDESQIFWESIATVWQRTGEVWENVMCEFSTARPGSAASAPVLFDDVIRTQPRADKVVHVEAREVEISSAGHEGGVQTSQMPGVDDGGEPLVLTSAKRVSIPSNGRPFRILIGEEKVACRTSKVVTPHLSSVPHIRAEATWKGEYPILAGPVNVVRAGAFVGRADVGFVPPSEGFEIGFGVDSDVTVRAQSKDEHDSTLTGRTSIERTTTLFLNNLSNAPNHVVVRVRVPISEIEDVKIKSKFGTQDETDGYSVKEGSIDKDGFVDLTFDLEPHCTGEYAYQVLVDSGRKVSLSF